MRRFWVLVSVVSLVSTEFVNEVSQGSSVAVDKGLHPADQAKTAARDLQDFQKFPDKSKGPQRGYSTSEVAERDGKDGRPLFLIVANKVYDVTDYADQHPAGPEPLQRHAGQDATAAMRASGMPKQVYDDFLKFFLVGWINKMAEIQRFTMAEVSQRNGKNGQPIWIVYKDSVYDVTKYIGEHPGGVDSIVDEAGTDSTKAFDESGHTPDAKVMMAKYKIGELVEEEKRFDANGKKKKKVVDASEGSSRSCMNIVTCGLLG